MRKSKKSSEVTITAYSIYLVMNAKYSVYDDTPHNNPLCFDDRRALYLMKDNSFRRHKNSKTLSLTRSLVLLTYSSSSEILAFDILSPVPSTSNQSSLLSCTVACLVILISLTVYATDHASLNKVTSFLSPRALSLAISHLASSQMVDSGSYECTFILM